MFLQLHSLTFTLDVETVHVYLFIAGLRCSNWAINSVLPYLGIEFNHCALHAAFPSIPE
jgi:hypothetical protein